MDLRGGDGDRNASGLLTTGRMRGGDAAGLGGDAASSSLFALQQVLQRDNSKAIASALASLVSRAYRRDYVVLDEWIRSSPRLAELFSKGSRDTELSGDRDARLMSTLRTFSVALDRISNDDHARDVWHRVSRDWSGIFVRCLRGGGAKHVGLCHAALDALQAFVRRVGAPSARVVASWMAGDADGASLWGELVRPTKHTATRTKAIHLTATILASTEKEAKLAVLDEARGIVPLILNGDTSHSNDYSVAAANRRLLESIANRCLRTEGDDGALRRACLRVCASEKGLASLRGLASKNQTRKAAVDLLGLIVLDPSWLEFASRKSSGVKEEHANAIRALDPAGDPKQLEILVAVLRAAPTLLVRWLATSSRSALCSPRPWDKGGEEGPSERSLAGCAAFRAVLRVPTTRILSAPQDEDFPPEHIINACLPPEDVLSKKELTRGVLHSHEKAKIAALEVILDVLERFAVEVKDLFDDDDWEDSTEVSDQLAAALERALAPEGNTRDDFLLVNKLYANCQTDEMIHLKHVKYDTRKIFRERLPDVQTLLNIVNNPNTTESVVSLALAALRRYCLTIPGAVKDVKWDILKAVANTAANLGTVPDRDDRNALMLNQLAGLARVHPIDQTQRIRRPQRADKTAVKVRPILLAAVPRSAPIRALFDDAMIPITNSARERRIWLSELAKTAACEDSDDASSLFRLLERADTLKKLPPKAIDVTTNGLDCFNAAMQENTDYFWEHWEDDDDEDDTRYGLISPLVCAGLLLQGDERIAAMITRVVPNLVHTAGASDLRAIIALCQAVNTLSGKTTLRSFARSLEADLSVDGSTAVLETPTKIHSDEKMREGDASKEQLISMLTGKLGTPLLTPMSKRTLVYHSLRDEGDSSFRLLRQTITDVSFWLLVTHVCAPFTSGNDCVAETPWGAAVVKDAVEKIIASAGKDVCLDACRAAALGVARCSARGEARKVMRSAQRDLADYLLARKPDLTSTLDLDLCYGEDDPFTPLTILSRAHAAYASPEDLAVAAPRAMVIAEKFVRSLNNPCYELTSYVSPSTASAALESAAARDMPPSVLKILQYSPRESRDISVLGTRALFELWLRHEDAPEIVDDILTPVARLNAHKLLYSPDDDLGQSVQACWETAKGPSVSRSRRRAAQSCAAALVATDSSARARLRQLIFREVENNCLHFTERFYPAIRELAHYDTFSASTRDKWLTFLGKFAAAEVDLAVRGALTEDKPRPGVARLCDCARLLLPHSYEAAKRASGYLANARILANAEELSAFADVAQAAIIWSRSVDSGPPPEVEYVVFRSFALSSLPALTPRSVFPSSLDKDLVDALASKFSTCEESGALLLRVSRSVQSLPEFSDTSLNSVVNCVTKFPRVALGLLDTFGCISQAVLDATLVAYTASLSSMDRIALRILTRCGLPADSIGLRAWAARKTSTNEENTATESLSGVIEVVAGEWIFDFLQPDRIAASVVRFPLSRGITGGDDMEDDDDDDFSVDVPEDDDDDEDIEMADDDDADEVPDEVEGLDWEDQRIGRKDDDNDNSSEDATEEESDKEEEDDADQNSDEGSDVDDYEAEDGLSLADEEEIVNEETVWCAKCYDPRFVLPACYNCLTAAEKTEDEEEEARITRRAYESGAIAYAAAALSSKRSKTRSLAAGVLGRFSAKLGTGAASMDRGFVARPFVRTLLDATFAALKEASDPLHGPRRLPCLWSSVIARCFEALMSPRHPGFAVAAAHAVRRAIARPWHDAPLVRDAFLNDQGVANFCDDDALDKVRARFWSYECLVDGARDDNDAKALKRSGVLTLSMCRMEELLVGGASIVGEDKRVILKYAGMAPPGAASLLQQKNGKEDLKKLRKVNILAQAEGDAAHRMLASIGRSRYGKRILFTEWAVTYLASRLASTHEARDIELVGAILHFTCEDLDYFTEEREPLLFGYLDLAAEVIMRGFYKLSQLPEERREIDPAYREVVLDEVDDGDLDEFFSTPLKCVGDFDDDTKKSSLSASEASVEASSRFFFRRYLVTRHVALAGLGRISQFTDRRVSIIEAWCMMRAMIIMCYGGEDVDFHSASLRVLSTLDAADTKRLLALAPPVIMYLGYELNVELYDENPIGNRLYTPLIEIIVSILIARLLTTRISRCLVSARRQLVATVDLVLRVARIHQAKPGVDMLAAARLDLGLGCGLAFRVEERLSSSPPTCPHHRIHDLRRASKVLADEDCLGERRGMACSLDVLLADAIHEEEVSSAPRDLIIPADVAKLLSHDDILNSPNPQPGDESHLRAIKRIEALAPSLASNSLTAETAHRILREYKRPDFDPKALDVYTNLKFCDVCQGKKPAPDLEKLDPHKRRWWRVDLDPNS